MSSVPERGEIEETYTWDLESVYASDEDWETAYEAVEARLDEIRDYEGRVTESAETLHEVLELGEELSRAVSQVTMYARLRRDEDTRNQTYQALTARAQSLAADASSASSFVEPEIQECSREEIETMIEQEPALETYEHYFDDVLRMKPHTRSAEVEELLAELSEVTGAASDVYTMLTNADMTFPSVEHPEDGPTEVTLSNFVTLQKEGDREFRREVYEAFYDEWADVRNAVGSAYKNSVKADIKLARARNYETAREAALDGPNIPVEVYDTLVETVSENYDPLHRHVELKREALGVDELRMWDVYMPAARSESPDLEYDRAAEYVVESVAPLGEAYQSRLAEGLDSRWVDVYENAGKQSGAYSSGTYDTQPFILMNYQDDVASMYTLAHELGHSLHSEFTKETQPYVYSGYEIFVAEVASTVNETLLTHHLLETVEDDELRLHVLNEYLERFRSTLYRQTMFAEFEHRAHEIAEDGGALTPDALDELYGELKSELYAPAEVDDRIAREWMRIPHFYRAYYVFQYATGISAAVAIVQSILEEGGPAAERYLEFLSAGSRDYPLSLLEITGVDMTSSEPVEEALSVYETYVDEMAELV